MALSSQSPPSPLRVTVVSAGVATINNPFPTAGLYHFTVSAENVGGDVFTIQGVIGTHAPRTIATISGDGHYLFDGVYDQVKVLKSSGSGTTANIIVLARE